MTHGRYPRCCAVVPQWTTDSPGGPYVCRAPSSPAPPRTRSRRPAASPPPTAPPWRCPRTVRSDPPSLPTSSRSRPCPPTPDHRERGGRTPSCPAAPHSLTRRSALGSWTIALLSIETDPFACTPSVTSSVCVVVATLPDGSVPCRVSESVAFPAGTSRKPDRSNVRAFQSTTAVRGLVDVKVPLMLESSKTCGNGLKKGGASCRRGGTIHSEPRSPAVTTPTHSALERNPFQPRHAQRQSQDDGMRLVGVLRTVTCTLVSSRAQASLPAQADPSGSVAAHVPASQNPDVQSPSPVQAAPFACGAVADARVAIRWRGAPGAIGQGLRTLVRGATAEGAVGGDVAVRTVRLGSTRTRRRGRRIGGAVAGDALPQPSTHRNRADCPWQVSSTPWQELRAASQNLPASSQDPLASWQNLFASLQDLLVSWQDLLASWQDLLASWQDLLASWQDRLASWQDRLASWQDPFASCRVPIAPLLVCPDAEVHPTRATTNSAGRPLRKRMTTGITLRSAALIPIRAVAARDAPPRRRARGRGRAGRGIATGKARCARR